MEIIKSFSNPKIKLVKRLWQKAFEKDKSFFLVEGRREVQRAILGGFNIKELFFCKDFFKADDFKFLEKIKCKKFECFKELFKKISYRKGGDGFLAIFEKKFFGFEDIKDFNFLVVLEKIEKPGNLGAILRTTCAVGVEAVFIDPTVDIFNFNVIRSSLGSVFMQKIVIAKKEKIFSFLKENKVKIVAATAKASKFYTDVDYKKNKRVGIILGSEKDGLSQFWLDKTDLKIKIPMKRIDSLNVSIATAILCYEVVRQRDNLYR